MCELLGMSSNLPATITLSLMKLAEHGGFTGPHRDGWGVAYYEGADVRLLKEAEAAARSDWVRFIRDHSLKSHLVMAHVRRATMGERAYRNTQPFARELVGRMHLFAHNGWLPGILDSPGFRSTRFQPVGETDSEQAFCALLDRMADVWKQAGGVPALGTRLSIVSSFAADMRSLGPANFLYSDGDALFAHGDRRRRAETSVVAPPGLVSIERRCRKGEHGFVTSGLSIDGADQSVTLVASVPLTDEIWQPLAEGEVVALCKGEIAARRSAGVRPVL
jgi:predicted glutamine amidotransferase